MTVWTSGVENSKFENFMRDAKSEIAELSDGKQFVCSSACTAGKFQPKTSVVNPLNIRYKHKFPITPNYDIKLTCRTLSDPYLMQI